jgi:hypothetical protein
MSIMDTRLAVAVLASLIGGLLVVAPPAAGQVVAYEDPSTNTVKIAKGIDKSTQNAETIVDTGVSDAVTLGRISDLDDDGTLEVPAINDNGDLVLIEPNGSADTLTSSAAAGSRAALGVGDGPADASTNGEPEIIYRGTSPGNGEPFYFSLSGSGNRIVQDSTEGIFGFGDYNDDGAKNVAYLDADPADITNNIFYVDGGNPEDTGYPGVGGTVEGIGPLADFDFDGVPRAAVITESATGVELALVDTSGTATTISSSASPATLGLVGVVDGRPLPIGAADVSGDYELEIIFVDGSDNLKAIDLGGNVTKISGPNGTIQANPSVGVSGDHNTTELKIEGTKWKEGDPADPTSLGADAGWRMIGPPVQNVAPDDLESIIDPAGSVIEFDLESGDHMFFEWNDSQGGWNPVTPSNASSSSSFENGHGYLLFLFDDEGTSDADPLDPTLPIHARRGNAIVPTDDVEVSELNTDADFHLLANPYNQAFDLTSLEDESNNGLGSNGFKSMVQIWDGGPSNAEGQAQTPGSYVSRNAGNSNVVSAWQAFFVERGSSDEKKLTFREEGRDPNGERNIVGSRKSQAPGREPARIGFKLTVENSDGTQVARDEAASLYFHPDATPEADGFDASKLTPLTYPYATIGPVGPTAAGDTAIKAQESRPMDAESPLEVPFQMQTAGSIEGTARLRATQWHKVPSDWSLTLIDTKGTADPDDDVETALTRSDASGYTFEIDAPEKRVITGRHPTRLGGDASRTQGTSTPRPHRPEALRLADAPESKTLSPADSIPRFTVRVSASGDRLPVELAAFDARVEDRRAHLSWQTAGETNNAGFYVQHRPLPSDDETTTPTEWSSLGFVEGAGTTDRSRRYTFETEQLSPGPHAFRLRQVDTDGRAVHSQPLEVTVSMEAPHMVSGPSPNPVQGGATLDVAVRRAQDVQVALYNVLGQRVATVHRGTLPGEETTSLRLDASSLSSGVYFVRVDGEDFTTTKQVTVVR